METPSLSLKHVRRNCLNCSGDSARAVTWCSCDGQHSTACEFWPFRFGTQPSTFLARHGGRLLDPERMPPADVELDKLPSTLKEASLGAIDVDGYRQPAEEAPVVESRYSEEQRRAMAARLNARKSPSCSISPA